MRVTSHTTRPSSNVASSEARVGADHPLARAAERHRLLLKYMGSVAVVLCGSAAAQLAGLNVDSLTIVAAMVEATLACSLLLVASDERRLARELIIAGRADLPLPPIASERQRLLDPDRRQRLARSVDRIRAAAKPRRWLLRGSRPLFRVQVIAAVSPQLTELATALRSPDCEAAGVAMTQRLLCDGDSPLYGDDVALLRETLQRIRSRLNS